MANDPIPPHDPHGASDKQDARDPHGAKDPHAANDKHGSEASRKRPSPGGKEASQDREIEETIQFTGSDLPGDDSTIVPETKATVEFIGHAKDDGPASGPLLETTVIDPIVSSVDLQQTPDSSIDLDEPSAEGGPEHSGIDLHKTLPGVEETVVEDGSASVSRSIDNSVDSSLTSSIEKSTSATRIYRGKRSSSRKTVSDLAGRTKSNLDGSIMSSASVDMTINPRELSDKDTIAWNNAVGSGNTSNVNPPSQLTPAIERTFSDRQFEKLRVCHVAEEPEGANLTLDFKLLKKLGQGGMGDVFLAHQASLDRRLALKLMRPIEGRKRAQLNQTGKLSEFEENRRQQFLSEAIVTSDLDHPNIVPIHEAGFSSKGELFYAMKCVVGDPWSDKIKTFSRDENIDVLMKVCDAIACAHNRGVVHRDIKPQNVMLGDFGVVLVMDWGLALPTPSYEKAESILATSGLGGTPAFMAPEMAAGPIESIGPASDIYLLGATLFLIVTGQAPHQGRNVTECMNAVRNNEIREVPREAHGELLNIALKAMASVPEKRYAKVEDFQQAIRDYRSHAESISLATGAFEYLEQAKTSQSDADYSRASFGFEAAIRSWQGNVKAHQGLAQAVLLRAQTAYEKKNFELGLSLLDEDNPEHAETITKIRAGMHEAHHRIVRLARARKFVAALLGIIFVGGSVAFWVTDQARKAAVASAAQEKVQRDEAVRQTQIAKEQEQLALEAEQQAVDEAEKARIAEADARRAKLVAEDARTVAEQATKKAVAAKNEADAARAEAEAAEKIAKAERQKSKYEEYVSKIGLAKAKLQDNDAENARVILEDIRDPQSETSWEWRWLWDQATQSTSSLKTGAPVVDLSLSPAGTRGAVVLNNGDVERVEFDDAGKLVSQQPLVAREHWTEHATAVAYAPTSDTIAVGTLAGDVLVVSPEGVVRSLPSVHTEQVTDLEFTDDGVLVSGSDDRTVRFWDLASDTELSARQACWHLSPVRQIAVAGSGAEITLAVATGEESTGTVTVWNVATQNEFTARQSGVFTGHDRPVECVALSPDGRLGCSGDIAGNALLWNPSTLEPVDYSRSVANALTEIRDAQNNGNAASERRTRPTRRAVRFARLIDASDDVTQQFISTMPAAMAGARQPVVGDADQDRVAHHDVVRSIRFSRDGRSLLTSSDDNTLKLWQVDSRRLQRTLRGHGGWVVAADFLPNASERVVSASNDATVRTWDPPTYVSASIRQHLASVRASDSANDPANDPASDPANETTARETTAHENDIVSARFSPDGTKLVTASGDRTARIMAIDPQTLAFREVARVDDELLDEGTPYVAMSMHADTQRNRLLIGNADSTIRIWDLNRGVETSRVDGTGINNSFAVSSDGQLLLTGSSSPTEKLILWQFATDGNGSAKVKHRMAAHDEAVTAMAISPDSKLLFSGDRGGYGILWDAASGKRLGDAVETVRGFRINDAQFSRDSRSLFLAADDEQLTQIDVNTKQIVARMNHDGFVSQVSLSGDGKWALTVSELTKVDEMRTVATLWDLATGKGRVIDEIQLAVDAEKPVTARDRRRITAISFDDASSVAAVSRTGSRGGGGVVKLVDLESMQPTMFELPARLGSADAIVPLDASTLVTMNANGAFKWDLDNERLLLSYRSQARLTAAVFSWDGELVATSSRSVKVWNASNGQALAKLEAPHMGPVRTIAMSPTDVLGQEKYLLATAGDDAIVRTWSFDKATNTIQAMQELRSGEDSEPINRICFSPDSARLLAVGDRGSVAVYTLDGTGDGKGDVRHYQSGDGDLVSAAFSRDGQVIAAGGTDHTVHLWSLAESPKRSVVLKGHAGTVDDIVLDGSVAKGIRVMTASASDAKLWDPRIDAEGKITVPEGREILSLRGHKGDVTAVDIADQGQLLMTASSDGTVILWPAKIKPQVAAPNIFDDLLKSKP